MYAMPSWLILLLADAVDALPRAPGALHATQAFSCQHLHLIAEPALPMCMGTTLTKDWQKLLHTALNILQFYVSVIPQQNWGGGISWCIYTPAPHTQVN